MTGEAATWRTSEPCPACGTDLAMTDTGSAVTWDCPACGWTDTWQAGGDDQ